MSITQLTPEQEAALTAFREQWRSIGLSTEPVDRAATREAVSRMHRAVGLQPPDTFLFFSSPLTAIAAIDTIKSVQAGVRVRAQLNDQMRDQLPVQLGDQLYGRVYDQLRVQLHDQLSGRVRVQLYDQLGDQLSDQLRDQLYDQLYDQLRVQLYDQLAIQLVGTWFLGSGDAYWLAWYLFAREHIGVRFSPEQNEWLDAYSAYAQSAFWMWPFKEVVFVSDRPRQIAFDSRNRLHCEDGPAIQFADGWAIHAIHGVRVPDYVVEQPNKITLDDIRSQKNTEVRRVMIDRYGLARYIEDSGAHLIHSAADSGQVVMPAEVVAGGVETQLAWLENRPEHEHHLFLYELEEDAYGGRVRMARVRNGTPEDGADKFYWLHVPQDIDNVNQAVAATYPGLSLEQYLLMVRS